MANGAALDNMRNRADGRGKIPSSIKRRKHSDGLKSQHAGRNWRERLYTKLVNKLSDGEITQEAYDAERRKKWL